MFHVSLLELYQRRPGFNPSERPEAIKLDSDEEYEVEEILDYRVRYKKLEFYVRWKGYTPADD